MYVVDTYVRIYTCREWYTIIHESPENLHISRAPVSDSEYWLASFLGPLSARTILRMTFDPELGA